MKRFWFALLLIGLTACSTSGTSGIDMSSRIHLPTGALPDLGPAPELKNSIWLNTAAPLHIADLRGQGGRRGDVDLRVHQLPARDAAP